MLSRLLSSSLKSFSSIPVRRLCSIPSINDEKKHVLSTVSSKLRLEDNYVFFQNYFDFASECKVHKKLPMEMFSSTERKHFLREFKEALPSFDERKYSDGNYTMRATRSALEFLFEDIVSKEREMLLPWRIFINGEPVERLNHEIRNLDDDRSEFPEIVENEIPISHNWWRPENRFPDWEWFQDDKSWLLLDDVDHNPLLPSLAVRHKEDTLAACLSHGAHQNGIEALLTRYFDFSTACRLHQQHPSSLLTCSSYNGIYPGDSMVTAIKKMDEQILWTLSLDKNDKTERIHPKLSFGCIENLKMMRSAIEFIEEEFVAHCKDAQKPWKRFREGKGFRELELALMRPETLREVGEAIDLRMVPGQHSWWTEEDRAKSENKYGNLPVRGLPPFTLHSIESAKKRVISSALKLCINQKAITVGTDFLWNYFCFSNRVRSIEKDPVDFWKPNELQELRHILSTATEAVDVSLLTACDYLNPKTLWKLRACRSAVEFLEEEIVDEGIKSTWQWLRNGSGLKKIDKILMEFDGQESPKRRNYSCLTTFVDISGVPLSHKWWPMTERKKEDGFWLKQRWCDLD